MIRTGGLQRDFMALNRETPLPALAGLQTLRWADLKPILVTCSILAAVTWQLVVPVLANTSCGLIVPHEHVLVGYADNHDLARHEAAETACVAGKPAVPHRQAAELHNGKGHILSVVQITGATTTHVISLDSLIAFLSISADTRRFQQFHTRLDPDRLPGQSVVIPPVNPPPEAA